MANTVVKVYALLRLSSPILKRRLKAIKVQGVITEHTEHIYLEGYNNLQFHSMFIVQIYHPNKRHRNFPDNLPPEKINELCDFHFNAIIIKTNECVLFLKKREFTTLLRTSQLRSAILIMIRLSYLAYTYVQLPWQDFLDFIFRHGCINLCSFMFDYCILDTSITIIGIRHLKNILNR